MKDIEIIIVTFKYDIPNTYMQLISLGKNLTTRTKIKIYYNYQNKKDEVYEISLCNDYIRRFLKNHDVKFFLKPAIINNTLGWYSQQLLKWYAAYHSDCQYQMVLDSKNFLFRPFSLDEIDFANLPAFGKDITDQWTQETINHCQNFIFEKTRTQRKGQLIDAITPWIWDNYKVKEMLDTLWPDNRWYNLSGDFLVSEWLLYITWVEQSVKYDTNHHLTTGMWGSIDDTILDDFADLFKKSSTHKFWTHHRIKNKNQHFEITRRLINEFDICKETEYIHWVKLRNKYNLVFPDDKS